MTFSVVQLEHDDRPRKVIGTLWAADEAGAKAIAPALLGLTDAAQFNLERSEERELPLKIRGSAQYGPFC